MHGFIFEAIYDYWQDQPGNFYVLTNVPRSATLMRLSNPGGATLPAGWGGVGGCDLVRGRRRGGRRVAKTGWGWAVSLGELSPGEGPPQESRKEKVKVARERRSRRKPPGT
ncbi:hypothetical protein CEXT_658481 [Caerostris extrusa]|uniref:Uncharacterized protein n=1 Tax=Caerostris extrusa TaxID=172846 RepID=A0AAV4PWR3_CAEEX|nr:hypothetical protein CEXT_658481 [Caerostris extrusa]